MFISNCCGAKIVYLDEKTLTGMCSECKERSGAEKEEDDEMTLGSMDRF